MDNPSTDEIARDLGLTPSTRATLEHFGVDKEVTAWDLAQHMLTTHASYAGGLAGKIGNGTGPGDINKEQPAVAWFSDVRALLDQEKAPELHVRVVLIALARLDDVLGAFFDETGLLNALNNELREAFEDLLIEKTPEDEARLALRDEQIRFIRLLNNQGKSKSNLGEDARTTGFLALVSGAADLSPFRDACFSKAQSWNQCYTATFKLPSGNIIPDLFIALFTELNLLQITSEEIGEDAVGRPGLEPSFDKFRTHKSLSVSDLYELTDTFQEVPGLDTDSTQLFKDLVEWLPTANFLKTGRRLVLFAEVSSSRPISSLQDLGLSPDNLDTLQKLSDRVGIVISSVPDSLSVPSGSLHVERFALPQSNILTLGQTFSNDLAQGPDLLEIKSEVYALAEMISLENLSPPLVVGVLGGWGWGKSFVLHLLEQRIKDIRAEDLRHISGFPYIGHPYIIRFDAWTYAKTNLWASLMQTILFELNRQLGIENALLKIHDDPKEGGPLWQILNGVSDDASEELVGTDLGEQALDIFRTASADDVSTLLWDRLSTLRTEEREKLQQKKDELAQKKHELAERMATIEEVVDSRMALRAKTKAWAPLYRTLVQALGDKVDDYLEKATESEEADAAEEGEGKENKPVSIESLRKEIPAAKKIWMGLKEYHWPFMLFVVVVLATPFIISFLDENLLDMWMAGAASAVTIAFNLWMTFKKGAAWVDKQFATYKEEVKKEEGRLKDRRQSLTSKMRSEMETQDTGNAISTVEEEVRKLEAEVENHRQRAGLTAEYRSLVDFVQGRIDDGYYDQKLGLIHQVQQDMKELTEALLPQKGSRKQEQNAEELFPRGEPRIVLIIDDLDRCPPAKVVEVLEAAQLLVKTRLFVLILAMDVRYITRALEKSYTGVLERSGEPSGLDYIEKIVQIPYRVRPIQPDAMMNFLSAQMELESLAPTQEEVEAPSAAADESPPPPADAPPPEDPPDQEADEIDDQPPPDPDKEGQTEDETIESAPLPTSIRKFEEAEIKMLADCCNAVVVSPRTVKRLVNVFKLLKIIWDRRGKGSGPNNAIKRTMMMLLTLSARYPEIMQRLLQRLDQQSNSPQAGLPPEIQHFLKRAVESELNGEPLFKNAWERVDHLLNNEYLFDPYLTFSEVDPHDIRLIGALSMIGDSERGVPFFNNQGTSDEER